MKLLAPFFALVLFSVITVNTIIWYAEDKNYSVATDAIESYERNYANNEEVLDFISKNKDRWIKNIKEYEPRYRELAKKWEGETSSAEREKYFKELMEIYPMVFGFRKEIYDFIKSREDHLPAD